MSENANVQVIHNEAELRFEAAVGDELALLQYRRRGDRIVFLHTEVPQAAEGQGIGSQLAQAGLAHAREHALRVVPLCPFIKSYLERHPDEAGLVDIA